MCLKVVFSKFLGKPGRTVCQGDKEKVLQLLRAGNCILLCYLSDFFLERSGNALSSAGSQAAIDYSDQWAFT